ncbi:MAG: hypothetical protein UX32_C0008G0033, partial [Microgenomates group bacterium GW2011_GWF1_46_12]
VGSEEGGGAGDESAGAGGLVGTVVGAGVGVSEAIGEGSMEGDGETIISDEGVGLASSVKTSAAETILSLGEVVGSGEASTGGRSSAWVRVGLMTGAKESARKAG